MSPGQASAQMFPQIPKLGSQMLFHRRSRVHRTQGAVSCGSLQRPRLGSRSSSPLTPVLLNHFTGVFYLSTRWVQLGALAISLPVLSLLLSLCLCNGRQTPHAGSSVPRRKVPSEPSIPLYSNPYSNPDSCVHPFGSRPQAAGTVKNRSCSDISIHTFEKKRCFGFC